MVLLVLASSITLFAVLNFETVKVNWIFGSGHAPLIIVIVVSLLVGIVLTYFVERRPSRRRRRRPARGSPTPGCPRAVRPGAARRAGDPPGWV